MRATAKRTTGAIERATVAVTGVAAILVAAIVLGATVVAIVSSLTGETLRIDVEALARAGTLTGLPGVADATWTSAAIDVRATAGERILVATGTLLSGLTWIAVALAVAFLARRVRHGSPFTRTLTRTAWFSAFALIVGPTVAALLIQLGQNEVVDRIGAHGPVLLGFAFDAGPWVAGVALSLVALLLQLGERLQRDTEGLV